MPRRWNRLWAAADQLHANSGLTSAQYSQPVLGLIFLRFAEVRFQTRLAALEKQAITWDDIEPAACERRGVLDLEDGTQ